MLDLKTQLGDYFDHVIERVDIEDVLQTRSSREPVPSIQPRSPGAGPPRWVVAAAAAAAVLILIGGAAWLTRSPSTVAPVDQPADESVDPIDRPADESVDPVDQSAAEMASWSQHQPTFGTEAPESLTDAAVTPFGLFAAGYGGAAPVWTSEDGIEWTPVGVDSIQYDEPSFSYIEGSELGLLLISPRNGAWFSPDGAEWTAVPDIEIGDDELSYISVMAASQRGFLVAVHRSLWFSRDGLEWTELDGSFIDARFAIRVAANADAFYATADDDAEFVWRSVDGVTWEPQPVGAVIDGVCDLAASDLGVVIVECGATNSDTIWYSPEGRTWTHVTDIPTLEDGHLFRIGGSENGFLLTTVGDEVPLRAWLSSDGMTWKPLDLTNDAAPFGNEVAYEILPLDDGLVAIGESLALSTQRSLVWIYAP